MATEVSYPSRTLTSLVFDNLIVKTSQAQVAASTINGAVSRNAKASIQHSTHSLSRTRQGSFKPVETALAQRPAHAQATTVGPFSSQNHTVSAPFAGKRDFVGSIGWGVDRPELTQFREARQVIPEPCKTSFDLNNN